jgi:hypothetical protein
LLETSRVKENYDDLNRMLQSGYGKTAIVRTIAFPVVGSVDLDNAIYLLETAEGKASAPVNYFNQLSMAYARLGKNEKAKRTVDSMAARFGWAPTYTTGIHSARILGDAEWAHTLLNGCKATKDKDRIDDCEKAMQGESANNEYKTVPGILGVFAQSGKQADEARLLAASEAPSEEVEQETAKHNKDHVGKVIINTVLGTIFN